MTTVRLITADEAPVLLPGAREFFAEGAMPGKLSEHAFLYHVQQAIERLGFVAGLFKGDVFCGALGAVCVAEWATGDVVAMEQFWFVLREHRFHGLKLLDFYEAEAQRRGCVRAYMVHLNNLQADQLDRLFARRGYALVEKVFTKTLL